MNHFSAILLQTQPQIFLAKIPGKWLLKRVTPSWRIKQPLKGFQRMVNEKRARQIAAAVLDQERGFPNAIVIATDTKTIPYVDLEIRIQNSMRFLVIDGQHRLYAQKFSRFETEYACVLHVGLTPPKMGALFIEINDTQKRVPSSLRWDLVRLVKPEGKTTELRAAEIVKELNDGEKSPLRGRIDMTGEFPLLKVSQGSLAPEIKALLTRHGSPLKDAGFEEQLDLLIKYFAAIRECDPDGWRDGDSALYQNRHLRALLKLFPEIARRVKGRASASDYFAYLSKLNLDDLSRERVISLQGRAGINELYKTMHAQVFKR